VMLKGYSLSAFASKADMPLRARCKIVHNSLSSTAPTGAIPRRRWYF
jgi:hypothetical protein